MWKTDKKKMMKIYEVKLGSELWCNTWPSASHPNAIDDTAGFEGLSGKPVNGEIPGGVAPNGPPWCTGACAIGGGGNDIPDIDCAYDDGGRGTP